MLHVNLAGMDPLLSQDELILLILMRMLRRLIDRLGTLLSKICEEDSLRLDIALHLPLQLGLHSGAIVTAKI